MNYFIDCGTHMFQGLKNFNKLYCFDHAWTIYSFEANPLTFSKSKSEMPGYQNLIHENKAVWINSSGVQLNLHSEDETTQGSNILDTPPSIDSLWGTRYSWHKKVPVQSLDLSALIQEIHRNDSSARIIVKMDIEGAEFEVLQKLISDGSHALIENLYVEFHERFFTGEQQIYEKRKTDLLKSLKEANVNVSEWE